MNSGIIDMHIHFGAPADQNSGCYWSTEFEKTAAYFAMLFLTRSLLKKVNLSRVKNHLLDTIRSSKYINQAVLLALDEVYDLQGRVHPERTHLYVPNDYLCQLSQEEPKILFGCSVHPYRQDWMEQLDRSITKGTVLCKWIPSSQLINPAHPRCKSFFQKLVNHKLPLLCHAGPEYAIPTSNKSYEEFNHPNYLREALEEGVTVIIAHCALPYFWIFESNYQQDFREFLGLVEQAEKKNWHLYADVSALATPLRAPYIKKILKKVPAERLLFGSDYPIPLSEFTYHRSHNFFNWLRFLLKVAFLKNPLDKYYLVIKKMGFAEQIFSNASRLFSQIKR
jgi:predicted TIM-barrel fold metal-dependent hydrolase